MVERGVSRNPDRLREDIENHGIERFNFGNGLVFFPQEYCIRQKRGRENIKLSLKQDWILIKLIENLLLNVRRFVPHEEIFEDIDENSRSAIVNDLRELIDQHKNRTSVLVYNEEGLRLSIPGKEYLSITPTPLTHTARMLKAS